MKKTDGLIHLLELKGGDTSQKKPFNTEQEVKLELKKHLAHIRKLQTRQ